MEKFKERAVWRQSDEHLDLALGVSIRLALAKIFHPTPPHNPTCPMQPSDRV